MCAAKAGVSMLMRVLAIEWGANRICVNSIIPGLIEGLVFAGTPQFAAMILQALLEGPHRIVAVYTQPDRPAPSAVKLLAQSPASL